MKHSTRAPYGRTDRWKLSPGSAALVVASLMLACPAQAQDDGVTAEEIGETAGTAVLTPLSDLNIRRDDIPPALANLRSPYEPVRPRTCSNIRNQIAALTEAIGPDADVQQGENDDTLERVGETAGSIIGGIIPLRGVVREVTGAAARDRLLLELHIRGVARRAYLKGLGQILGCRPPGAPTGYIPPLPPTDEEANR